MFSQNNNIKSIFFSNEFDTKNIKYICSMFYNCKKLESIDMFNLDVLR